MTKEIILATLASRVEEYKRIQAIETGDAEADEQFSRAMSIAIEDLELILSGQSQPILVVEAPKPRLYLVH